MYMPTSKRVNRVEWLCSDRILINKLSILAENLHSASKKFILKIFDIFFSNGLPFHYEILQIGLMQHRGT